MYKRLSALALAALLLAGCAGSQPIVFRNQPNSQIAAQANPQTFNRLASPARSDWFATLSPQLQAYYAPAKGKTGLDLMRALHQVISKGQKTFEYNDAKSFMYAVADNVKVNQQPGLFDAYSQAFIPGSGGNGNIYLEKGDQNQDGLAGDFINCEHTWPQSFFGKVTPMVSDMHHMFPTLSKPNAMRSNYPIGPVIGQVVYTTNGGAKLSVRDRTGRHNPAEVQKWFNLAWEQQPHDILKNDFDVNFEPPNVQKGNSARALLYFYLRYYDANIRSGAFDEKAFLDQNIPAWVQWAESDLPDAQEQFRHETIAQRQANRNPFVDIPNLGSLIGVQTLQAN